MQPVRSNVMDRTKRPTPYKRGMQTALIKTIQQIKEEERPYGDWLHTAGPGKLFINYLIYERAVHHDSKYMIIEYQKDLTKLLHRELERAKKNLVHHAWTMNIEVRRGELFDKTKKEINKGRRVLVVDADFCATAHTLVKTGLLEGMEMIVKLQAKNKQDFFMPLTLSMRHGGGTVNKDVKARNIKAYDKIKTVAHKLGGHHVHEAGYGDKSQMKSAMWYFPQR